MTALSAPSNTAEAGLLLIDLRLPRQNSSGRVGQLVALSFPTGRSFGTFPTEI